MKRYGVVDEMLYLSVYPKRPQPFSDRQVDGKELPHGPCNRYMRSEAAWLPRRPTLPPPVSSGIQRADHALAPAVEHMGIDHGGADVFMSEQVLHGADVVAVGQ